MDYKLTFEDGSSGYLAHHGVKGMKWGVWNAETSAKYGHLKAYGVSDKTLSKYVDAHNKEWRAANASMSGESKNPLRNFAYKRASRKLDKARSELADEYISKTAPLGWENEKDHSLGFSSARRTLTENSNRKMSLDEALKRYSADVTEFENTYRVTQATKAGKEAVERYIKFDTLPDQKPRSGIETAAKDGYILTSEKQGRKYQQLKAAKETAEREVDRFESNDDNWKVVSGSDVYKPKTASLQKEYDRLWDNRNAARKEYGKFVRDKSPYTYNPGDLYKGRYS